MRSLGADARDRRGGGAPEAAEAGHRRQGRRPSVRGLEEEGQEHGGALEGQERLVAVRQGLGEGEPAASVLEGEGPLARRQGPQRGAAQLPTCECSGPSRDATFATFREWSRTLPCVMDRGSIEESIRNTPSTML